MTAIASELAALSDLTSGWFESVESQTDSETIDALALQEETELLANRLGVFSDVFLSYLSFEGGGISEYADLAREPVGALHNTLTLWAFSGIDPATGTFDLSQLDDFGFREELSDIQLLASEPESLVSFYCEE